jgi:hypothetical protein
MAQAYCLKVQEKGGNQESKAGDSKEQTSCDSGCLPSLWD